MLFCKSVEDAVKICLIFDSLSLRFLAAEGLDQDVYSAVPGPSPFHPVGLLHQILRPFQEPSCVGCEHFLYADFRTL